MYNEIFNTGKFYMKKNLNNRHIILFIFLIHIFININSYYDNFLKIGSKKIKYENISPKGRYKVEHYKLHAIITIITTYHWYSGYVKIYDNFKKIYVYESEVYDGFDCGVTGWPSTYSPTIMNFCFKTQELEPEE